MKYDDVREVVKKGGVVTRRVWNGYKGVRMHDRKFYSIELETGYWHLLFSPTMEEYEADDWEEVENPPPVPAEEVEVYGGETIDVVGFPDGKTGGDAPEFDPEGGLI